MCQNIDIVGRKSCFAKRNKLNDEISRNSRVRMISVEASFNAIAVSEILSSCSLELMTSQKPYATDRSPRLALRLMMGAMFR